MRRLLGLQLPRVSMPVVYRSFSDLCLPPSILSEGERRLLDSSTGIVAAADGVYVAFRDARNALV